MGTFFFHTTIPNGEIVTEGCPAETVICFKHESTAQPLDGGSQQNWISRSFQGTH